MEVWLAVTLVRKNYKHRSNKLIINITNYIFQVLTAGHCIVKQIQIGLGNGVFVANVTPNEYYPTIESMYSVYLGVHNTSGVYTTQPLKEGIKMSVSKVIPVKNKKKTKNKKS